MSYISSSWNHHPQSPTKGKTQQTTISIEIVKSSSQEGDKSFLRVFFLDGQFKKVQVAVDFLAPSAGGYRSSLELSVENIQCKSI